MSTWLAVAGAVVGLEASLGGLIIGWLRFRPERQKTAAELWRENAEAWEARVKTLEQKVEHLTAENAVLRSVVSGETAINALTTLIKDNHAQVLAALTDCGRGD